MPNYPKRIKKLLREYMMETYEGERDLVGESAGKEKRPPNTRLEPTRASRVGIGEGWGIGSGL